MGDSFVIFKDHMKTLYSFLTVNGYEPNKVYPDELTKDEFFRALEEEFERHTELKVLIPRINDRSSSMMFPTLHR